MTSNDPFIRAVKTWWTASFSGELIVSRSITDPFKHDYAKGPLVKGIGDNHRASEELHPKGESLVRAFEAGWKAAKKDK